MKAVLQVLSDDERARIHERSLHVLAHTGMRCDTALGRRLLAEAGAHVDEATRVVRFPSELVEESLRLAPRRFALGGRRPGWSHPMNAGESTLLMDGQAGRVVDRATGELRASTGVDWLAATRLIDALDEVGVWWSMVEGAQPDPSAAGWIEYNARTFRNFSKHVQDSFWNPPDAPWLLEVLGIVFGRERVRREHPYSFLVTPVSPLIIEESITDSWLALRGWSIPLCVLPMPIMGATAPGSALATVLLGNCETLGMLCLAQAAEPGVPFIYAPIPEPLDLRRGRVSGGAAFGAAAAAAAEMARFYDLPVLGSGLGADPWATGAQAGYEKAVSAVMGGLAWPDLFVGPGMLAGATVLSFEQLLIDVEIWRLTRKAHQGIDSGDDKWLDDVIARVGPGGNFLGERSTRVNAHSDEWFRPGLGCHDSREAWVAAGRPDVLDEARACVDEILATHEPLPLGEDIEGALAQLRRRALDADA